MQNNISYGSEKIVSREALAAIVQDLKQQGKTIVTTNGSFDLLHIGHVTMLQEAKSLGDALIVGLNSDASVRSYKGKYRPICPQKQRVGMLAALTCTDYITIFDELTPIPLLEIIQPDIHVNSPEHGYECVEREIVERYGGHIHLAQLIEGISTSQLIARILEASSHTPCRGIFIHAKDLFELDYPSSERDKISGKLKFALLTKATLSVLRQFNSQGFRIFILSPCSEVRQEKDIVEILYRQGVEISLCSSIERAVEDFDVILAKSFVISGDMADIQIGRELNCKTILLKTPTVDQKNTSDAAGPHFFAKNFPETANFVRD